MATQQFSHAVLVARLRDSGEAIGLFGCSAEWHPYRQAEVGYMLRHACTGQGYGSEALQALCTFLLQADFHKLKALVIEGNWPSRRILKRTVSRWKARYAITTGSTASG